MDASNADHRLSISRADEMRCAFIQFHTYTGCDVVLKVMNGEDREVRMLLNERLAEGQHRVGFDFGTLSGTYSIRLMINSADAIDIETQQIKID